jgi:ArsR family transcriptional regulator
MKGDWRSSGCWCVPGAKASPQGRLPAIWACFPNTLSANLNVLSHAGLITSRREGRSILYTAQYDRMRSLLGFLVEDCCNGSPEICAPLAQMAQACCVEAV